MTGYRRRLDMFIAANGGYWGSGHDKYPVEDWRQEVCTGDTRRGYWEWVFQQADANGDPDTQHEPLEVVDGQPLWKVELVMAVDLYRGLDHEGTIEFQCSAHSRQHAHYKAEIAYPGCRIVSSDLCVTKVETRPDQLDDVICEAAEKCQYHLTKGCYHGLRHATGGGCEDGCHIDRGVDGTHCVKADK